MYDVGERYLSLAEMYLVTAGNIAHSGHMRQKNILTRPWGKLHYRAWRPCVLAAIVEQDIVPVGGTRRIPVREEEPGSKRYRQFLDRDETAGCYLLISATGQYFV